MKIEYAPERGRGFVRPGETEKQQNWGFSGIKKAAPIWSRLSEQLTCCALCVCDPKHKHGNDSRYQAGGQLPCLLGPYCAAIFIRSEREYFFRNSSRTKAHGANLSDSCSSAIFSCSLFVFCDGVLVDSLLVIVCTCKAMRRSSSRHGADVFILWVQYRVAVILFGLFVLSKLLKSHHRLVVVLFPSFPVSQDLNGTGKEDYHAFHFCVLTRQLHPI